VTPEPEVDFEIASPTICVIVLRGEHDVSTKASVAVTMGLAGDYRYVLVDLTECTFVDSMLVGAIAKGANRARTGGGELELAACVGRDPVRRSLELMRIDDLIAVHGSRAEGIASLERAEQSHRGHSRAPSGTVESTRQRPVRGPWLPNGERAHKSNDPPRELG
jgi:anti-anti-sigma regulatory factor